MSEVTTPAMRARPKRYLYIAVLIGLLSFLAYGATYPSMQAEAAPGTQASLEVDVDLTEWELNPSQFDFQQGDTVLFNITNSGRFSHNLEVSNTAQHLHSPTIGAGETTTLEVTLDNSGTYTIICAIPGHSDLGMTGELTVSGDNPAPAEGEFLGIPAMRLSPRNNTAVVGSSQEVRVTLHDFTLNADSIEGANVGGEGHWALFLDDELIASLGEPSYTLEGLSAGPHVIRAELRNNDGSAVEPALSSEATIQVPAAAPVPPSTPSVGGFAPTSMMLAGLALLGVVLFGSGTAIISPRRH